MRSALAVGVSLYAVATGVACAYPSRVRGDSETTVGVLADSIRRIGGRATLEKYMPCDVYEGSPYQKIASGSKRWVELAVTLLDYSDACYTEGIQASLGEAMKRAPENVLQFVGKSELLSAERICVPFVSAEESREAQLAKVRSVKEAIIGVKGPRFARQRRACLDFIEHLENRIVEGSPTQ